MRSRMSFSGRQFWLGDDYVSETMDFEEMLLQRVRQPLTSSLPPQA